MASKYGGVKVGESKYGGVLVEDDDEEEESTPIPSFIDEVVGGAEVVGAFGTGAVADILGGAAGAATAIGEYPIRAISEGTTEPSLPTAIAAQDYVSDALTYEPKTSVGKGNVKSIANSEIVQGISSVMNTIDQTIADLGHDTDSGALRTALAQTLPMALLDFIALKTPSQASKIPKRLADKADAEGARLSEEAEMLDAPTDTGMQEVADVVQTGELTDVTQMIDPDANFYQALDDLEISSEPLASFASNNPQFRSLEGGLSAIPASQLDAQQKTFIAELGQKADSLIEEYGGTLDKGMLEPEFKDQSLSIVDDLNLKIDEFYEGLDGVIKPETQVSAPSTLALINKIEKELGGELPSNLRSIKRKLTPKRTVGETVSTDVVFGTKKTPDIIKYPTHELLNTIRRDVGAGINKRQGVFKDANTGQLKRLYRSLKDDQRKIAEDLGFGDGLKGSDLLVQQRKQIEDNLVKLLGRDLQGSLMPKVIGALKGLERNRVNEFNSIVRSIPNKAMRQRIVVSALNDIMKGGGGHMKSLGVSNFNKFMSELKRQPALKRALYKNIPVEMRDALDSLAVVSHGVSRALQDKIPTGRVAAFFDDNHGFLRKMMGKGAQAAALMATKSPVAASVVGDFLNQATDGAKSAAEVLASPKFQSMIREAVKEGVVTGGQKSRKLEKAEAAFERGKAYRKWANALNKDERIALATMGTVNYLLAVDNEESPPSSP